MNEKSPLLGSSEKDTSNTIEREKTSRINFEAPKSLKIKFKATCVANDTDMTEEFIKFMREYVK